MSFSPTFFNPIIKFYNNQNVPQLVKNNKMIAISTAVTLSIIYLFREKVMKPPKHLRHIPYIGYFSVFKSLISGESFWDRTYKVVIPQIEAKESNGLYLV